MTRQRQESTAKQSRQSLSTVLLEVRREDGGQLGGLGLAGAAGRREVDGGDSVPDPAGSTGRRAWPGVCMSASSRPESSRTTKSGIC